MSREAVTQKTASSDSFKLAGVLRDCLLSGVIAIDATEKILTCTDEATILLGLNPAEISRLSLSAVPAELQKVVRTAAATHQPLQNFPFTVTSAGHIRTLQANIVPVNHSGPPLIFIVLNDITAARRLESNFAHLDRLASVGTLAAGMAHEVKNALVAVKTFIDLLLEKNPDAELTDVVRREMGRINSLVSQVLKFARPGGAEFGPVKLHEVLDHSLRMVQYQMDGKLISLNRSFTAASDIIHGDDYRLEQAFLNLFLNALEAMGPSGMLTVATEITIPSNGSKQARQLHVTIADTGVGVAPEDQARLFDTFFTTKQHGTGLGLPIVRRIVQEHNGSVTFRSELNQGTTFDVFFPLPQAAG